MHRITWYASISSINSHELIYRLHTMIKFVGVIWRLGSNGFLTKVQPFPMVGHYRMDAISGMGHPRSDSVMPLLLRTVVCND